LLSSGVCRGARWCAQVGDDFQAAVPALRALPPTPTAADSAASGLAKEIEAPISSSPSAEAAAVAASPTSSLSPPSPQADDGGAGTTAAATPDHCVRARVGSSSTPPPTTVRSAVRRGKRYAGQQGRGVKKLAQWVQSEWGAELESAGVTRVGCKEVREAVRALAELGLDTPPRPPPTPVTEATTGTTRTSGTPPPPPTTPPLPLSVAVSRAGSAAQLTPAQPAAAAAEVLADTYYQDEEELAFGGEEGAEDDDAQEETALHGYSQDGGFVVPDEVYDVVDLCIPEPCPAPAASPLAAPHAAATGVPTVEEEEPCLDTQAAAAVDAILLGIAAEVQRQEEPQPPPPQPPSRPGGGSGRLLARLRQLRLPPPARWLGEGHAGEGHAGEDHAGEGHAAAAAAAVPALAFRDWPELPSVSSVQFSSVQFSEQAAEAAQLLRGSRELCGDGTLRRRRRRLMPVRAVQEGEEEDGDFVPPRDSAGGESEAPVAACISGSSLDLAAQAIARAGSLPAAQALVGQAVQAELERADRASAAFDDALSRWLRSMREASSTAAAPAPASAAKPLAVAAKNTEEGLATEARLRAAVIASMPPPPPPLQQRRRPRLPSGGGDAEDKENFVAQTIQDGCVTIHREGAVCADPADGPGARSVAPPVPPAATDDKHRRRGRHRRGLGVRQQ
jgi:hypothetical protein